MRIDEQTRDFTILDFRSSIFLVFMPEWRNWQTRQLEGLVAFGQCRFKSCLRHFLPRENRINHRDTESTEKRKKLEND